MRVAITSEARIRSASICNVHVQYSAVCYHGVAQQDFPPWTVTRLCVRAFQFAIRIDSIGFVKKSAFRFTSCHTVFLA